MQKWSRRDPLKNFWMFSFAAGLAIRYVWFSILLSLLGIKFQALAEQSHYAKSQSFHAAFRSELGIPPGSSPEEAFQLGQVIKCRVLRSSSADQRLALSFITSSAAIAAARAAGASTNGSAAPPTATAPGATVTGEVELGALVSGAIRTVGESSFIVEVARSTGGSVNGVLGFQHLSDHASQVEGLKALLQPGQNVEDLLVIGECKRTAMLGFLRLAYESWVAQNRLVTL